MKSEYGLKQVQRDLSDYSTAAGFARPIRIWHTSYADADGKTARKRFWDVVVAGRHPGNRSGLGRCRCDHTRGADSGLVHKLLHPLTSCWHSVLTEGGIEFQSRVVCWKCGKMGRILPDLP